MKYLYILLLVIISSACNSGKPNPEKPIVNTGVDSILVTYYCGMIDSNTAKRCEKLASIQQLHPQNDYSTFIEIIDTCIVDSEIVVEIQSLLDKMEPVPDFIPDARMYITVKYLDNQQDNICLGMNSPYALFNGESVKLEEQLIHLLRQYSGYYTWFDETELNGFNEYLISQ